MLKHKKRFYKWIEFLAVVGIVLLIQGMAVTGSFYFTNPYEFCRNRPDYLLTERPLFLETELAEAEFYNFRMQVLTGDGTGKALVSLESTEHTDHVTFILHQVYFIARAFLWIGVCLCVFAFLILRLRKRYRVLRVGAAASLLLPPVCLLVGLIFRFSAVKDVLSCVIFSNYDRLFYDDPAFVSILPEGVLLLYAAAYMGLWLLLSMIFMIVYLTKKKHRRPHAF